VSIFFRPDVARGHGAGMTAPLTLKVRCIKGWTQRPSSVFLFLRIGDHSAQTIPRDVADSAVYWEQTFSMLVRCHDRGSSSEVEAPLAVEVHNKRSGALLSQTIHRLPPLGPDRSKTAVFPLQGGLSLYLELSLKPVPGDGVPCKAPAALPFVPRVPRARIPSPRRVPLDMCGGGARSLPRSVIRTPPQASPPGPAIRLRHTSPSRPHTTPPSRPPKVTNLEQRFNALGAAPQFHPSPLDPPGAGLQRSSDPLPVRAPPEEVYPAVSPSCSPEPRDDAPVPTPESTAPLAMASRPPVSHEDDDGVESPRTRSPVSLPIVLGGDDFLATTVVATDMPSPSHIFGDPEDADPLVPAAPSPEPGPRRPSDSAADDTRVLIERIRCLTEPQQRDLRLYILGLDAELSSPEALEWAAAFVQPLQALCRHCEQAYVWMNLVGVLLERGHQDYVHLQRSVQHIGTYEDRLVQLQERLIRLEQSSREAEEKARRDMEDLDKQRREEVQATAAHWEAVLQEASRKHRSQIEDIERKAAELCEAQRPAGRGEEGDSSPAGSPVAADPKSWTKTLSPLHVAPGPQEPSTVFDAAKEAALEAAPRVAADADTADPLSKSLATKEQKDRLAEDSSLGSVPAAPQEPPVAADVSTTSSRLDDSLSLDRPSSAPLGPRTLSASEPRRLQRSRSAGTIGGSTRPGHSCTLPGCLICRERVVHSFKF
jgi:hypothetical protein